MAVDNMPGCCCGPPLPPEGSCCYYLPGEHLVSPATVLVDLSGGVGLCCESMNAEYELTEVTADSCDYSVSFFVAGEFCGNFRLELEFVYDHPNPGDVTIGLGIWFDSGGGSLLATYEAVISSSATSRDCNSWLVGLTNTFTAPDAECFGDFTISITGFTYHP